MNEAISTNEIEQSVYAARPWLKSYDYWVRSQINYPKRSLYEILRRAAVEVPNQPATVFLGAELSYSQIKEQADKFANALHNLGITKGDSVGIMLPNCPQYVIATFAILRLGAIVVNVNPLYTPRELAVVAVDSKMRLLVTLDLLAPVALAVREQIPVENIVVTSAAEYSAANAPAPNIEGALQFTKLIQEIARPDLPAVEIDAENDVAVLQYTGGTTGVPKGAMLTHYNIFANVVQTGFWGHEKFVRGTGAILLVIPMYHVYGFTIGMLHALWIGAQMVLIPKYDVNQVLTAIRDFVPTYFPAVPTIYISLLNHPNVRDYGLEKIRVFNSGSAPLPVEVLQKFDQITGGALNEGYGLSEASPVTHSTPYLLPYKPGSIGLPYPDTDVKIVDLETGEQILPQGETGELCISGPQVMKGYWNRPDETDIALRADRNGKKWLYTGDIAAMDADGYFYIKQRKKDMILVSGFNVYPSEVEGVLYTHPAIMEAAVIGIPDAYCGESVKAFVVLKPEQTANEAEIIEYCKIQLTRYKLPRTIVFRESLPKTPVGKILHRVLRDEEMTNG